MKNILIKQAKLILESFNEKDSNIKQALIELEKLDKQGGLGDLINSPMLHNIVSILAPYATYYKVDQVLKLLKELVSESKEIRQKIYI